MKNFWFSFCLNIFNVAAILLTLMISFKPNQDPTVWPVWANCMYYAFCKPLLLCAIMMMFFTMLLGHFSIGARVLRNSYMRAAGKTTYLSALASPIVITSLYLSQDYAMYLTTPLSMILGAGHILCNLVCSAILYIVLEYPIRAVLGLMITRHLS